MHKTAIITLDEKVVDGLYRTVGKEHVSRLIEDLVRPHVLNASLDGKYRAMAADKERETEALAWRGKLVEAS